MPKQFKGSLTFAFIASPGPGPRAAGLAPAPPGTAVPFPHTYLGNNLLLCPLLTNP